MCLTAENSPAEFIEPAIQIQFEYAVLRVNMLVFPRIRRARKLG